MGILDGMFKVIDLSPEGKPEGSEPTTASSSPGTSGEQNFGGLPFANDTLMWALSVGLCGVVPAVLLGWFWRKGWL